MLVIDTPEKARRLVEAFEAAERGGPYVPECDVMKELEESEKVFKEYLAMRKEEKERSSSLLTSCSAGITT